MEEEADNNELSSAYIFHIDFHDRYPRIQLIYCIFGMY